MFSNQIYTSEASLDFKSYKALLVIPEIFGFNNTMQEITDNLSKKLEIPTFGLDIFFSVGNHERMEFEYTDFAKGRELSDKVTLEVFLNDINKTLNTIQNKHPHIKEFIVCGFCAGGRLAYLAGLDRRVQQIFSFYGSRSLSNIYNSKSAIDLLIDKRQNDKKLNITSFFGSKDTLITPNEINILEQKLKSASITFEKYIFDTGHAFFNHQRSEAYDPKASKKALKIIMSKINK
jgi:dienelactone hydrolase